MTANPLRCLSRHRVDLGADPGKSPLRSIVEAPMANPSGRPSTIGSPWESIVQNPPCESSALPGGDPEQPRARGGLAGAPVKPEHAQSHLTERPQTGSLVRPLAAFEGRRPLRAGYRLFLDGEAAVADVVAAAPAFQELAARIELE